jgi:hypothetical protein
MTAAEGPVHHAAVVAVVSIVLLAGSAAGSDDLGTLTRIGRGGVHYRWEKGGNRIDLCDRQVAWTDEHAGWVRDCLDGLPALYVRKAIQGGLKRIYRDDIPIAPWNFLIGAITESGVAVPPAPWGYVALGRKVFAGDAKRAAQTVVHELGHFVQWGLGGAVVGGTPGFTEISWVPGTAGFGLRRWSGFVTSYARTNHREDFAEACEYYWLSPDTLRARSPRKFAYMRDVIFEGHVSPPAVRHDVEKTVEVAPVVVRLGDTVDTVGSHVTVHGERFMGPIDGGFNTVRFRGARGLHLAVSRKTVHAWVPAIGTGSAPVTVTTQDGTSDAVAFRVKKPWWKFW